MVCLWMYAFCVGVRSSRKVEKAAYEDIAFRYLAGDQQPDHWTLREFRRRHAKALSELFVQTVKLAAHAGLVKLGQVAIDGTKIKANASKHKAMSYKRMTEEEKRIKEEIDQFVRDACRWPNYLQSNTLDYLSILFRREKKAGAARVRL